MIAPGDVVCDRYLILRVIGEGGVGVVFEAEHTGVGRKVALKALHADFASKPEVVERFQREARAAAAIGHDNIIDVIDFGLHEGEPFMVMEMLKGETLSERLARDGKVPLRHAVYILQQVLSALGAAHEAGIIHRDLKPENVFLTEKSGIPDFVKLLDFGIAKLRVNETGPDGKVRPRTKAGTVMGTPHYMAPEQALATGDGDARIDLYAAGVMLYEMTTGSVPFDSASEAEVLMEAAYRLHPVLAPSARDPGLPPELDAIVFRAMSKDRNDRYQDAAAFALALSQLVATIDRVAGEPAGAAISVSLDAVPHPVEAQSFSGNATLLEGTPPIDAVPVPAARSRRKFSTSVLVAGGLPLVLAAAATIVLLALNNRSLADARNHIVVPTRIAHVEPPVAPIDPNVHIELQQFPAATVVTIDGERATGRSLSLVRGSTHTIRIKSAGNEIYEATLFADRDRTIGIALVPHTNVPGTAALADPGEVTRRVERSSTIADEPSPTAPSAPDGGVQNPPQSTTSPAGIEPTIANDRANPLPLSNEF